jgi:Protein of unknown function (DUF2934)
MAKHAAARQAKVNSNAQSNSNGADPNPEQIAELAYFLWQDRGCPEGSAEEDWFNAERALRPKKGA